MPYHVYILASRRYGTLYIGITNNLRRRLEEHRLGLGSEFVKQYRIRRLVHVETFDDPELAITREKQLKKWNRAWKIRLIEEGNFEWQDLSHLIGGACYGRDAAYWSSPARGRRLLYCRPGRANDVSEAPDP